MNAQIFVLITEISYLLRPTQVSKGLSWFLYSTSQTGSTALDASPKLIKYLLSDRYNHNVYGDETKDPLLPLGSVKSGKNGKHDEHYVIDLESGYFSPTSPSLYSGSFNNLFCFYKAAFF